MQRDLGLAQPLGQRARRRAVGEQGVDLLDAAEAHHGVAAELGVVGGQKNPPRVLEDRLGDADLAVVEVEQGATIGGTVRDGDGERVGGARVEVGRVRAVADMDGTFTLRQVPSGRVVVRARSGELSGELALTLDPGDEVVTLEIVVD